MNEDELIQQAMQELEAELPAQEPQEAPVEEQPQAAPQKSLLQKAGDAWKSVGGGIAKAGFETKDFIFGEPAEEDKSSLRRDVERRSKELADESAVNSVSIGISQMVTGLIGAGKIMGPIKVFQKLKAGGKAARATYEITKAAGASSVVLDPHEDRLSDIIEEFPTLQNPVTAYLAADPDDSAAEGRFKNAIESIGVDFALLGAVKVVKLLRAGRQDEALKEIKKLEKSSAVEEAPVVDQPKTGEAGVAPAVPEQAGNADGTVPPPEASPPVPPQQAAGPDGANVQAGTTELRSADIRSRFTGADGKFDQTAAADGIVKDVEDTLSSGGTVEMVIEGKTRKIVSVQGGMMADAKGQRWGAAQIYMPSPGDDARIVLKRGDEAQPVATPKEDITERVGISQPIGPDGQRIVPTEVKEPGVFRTEEVTDKQLDDIVRGSAADARAIRKYGSMEEAVANGYKPGKNTKLPWQKLRGTNETMAFVRQTAKVLKGRYDIAKGGAVLSDARVRDITKELAESFNEDPALLLGQITEMGEEATKIVPYMEAALRIGNKMFLDADDLAKQIRLGKLEAFSGSAEVAQGELKARIAAAVDVMASANSMLANSGRALRRARRQFRVREADLNTIKNLDPAKLAIIMEKAGGDPKKIMLLADRKWADRVMDEATFHLTNGLLWMWPSHLVNVTTNALMLTARPTEKLFGSAALRLITKDPGRRAELSSVTKQALKEYSYTVTSLVDGWSNAVEAFRKGDSILSPHNTEVFQGGTAALAPGELPWKPVKSVWDLAHNAWVSANYRTIVGLPTRTMGAVDEMFKTMRYRAVVQSRAAVQAAEAGLNAADTKAFIQKSMNDAIDPSSGNALDAKALRESQMVGFQQDLDYDVTIGGSFGRALTNARRTAPALSLVLPFVKTPVNVIRYGIKMTPGLNMVQKEFRDAFLGKAGEEARAHAYGQFIMGSMFAGIAAHLAVNGRFTGAGPSDFKVKQELMATGWKPYSIVWTNDAGETKYFQMGRFDPFGMAMGLVADTVQLMQNDPDRDYSEAVTATVVAVARNLGEKTFLLNLNSGIEAALDPERNLPKWMGRTAGSMIPASSLMRGHNPDPYLREARGFLDNLIRGVPGLSETLPKSHDVFGDPIERTVGVVGTQDSDLVEAEHNRIMLQTGKGLGKPDPKLDAVDLRDITLNDGRNAYETFQKLSGHLPGKKSLKDTLATVIKSEAYQLLPDGDAGVQGTRLNRLGTVTQKYRQAARNELVRRYPELRPLIKQRQREAKGAILKNRELKNNGAPGARELLDSMTSR